MTFAEQAGKTTLAVTQIATFPARVPETFPVERDLARQGWTQSFERLDEILASARAE